MNRRSSICSLFVSSIYLFIYSSLCYLNLLLNEIIIIIYDQFTMLGVVMVYYACANHAVLLANWRASRLVSYVIEKLISATS